MPNAVLTWPSTRASLLAAMISCASGCMPLGAQQAAVLDSGTRVRVTIPGPWRRWPFGAGTEQLEGTVRSISPDTLSLLLSPLMGPVAIPRSSIRGVEISLGPSRRGHAILGGVIGAAIFGLRMYVVNQEPKTHHFAAHWQAAAVGGVLGFAGGAWIGGRVREERWREVRLPD